MKRRPVTEQTKSTIAQRHSERKRSCLNCETPLDILRADWKLREIAILTGFSLKTIQRQARAYNVRGHTHKHLCHIALEHLETIEPRTERIKELHARVLSWLK